MRRGEVRLDEYLRERHESRVAFSKRTGVSQAMISLLIRGEIWLSRQTAETIFQATGGEVGPTDFLHLKSES